LSGDHAHDHEHGHDHDHEHGHDHPSGIRAAVRELFRPHSHDAADSVDSALESSSEGIRAVKISLVALGVTALLQLALVVVTGSVALLADTIHNFSDALTAVPLWIAFALARRKPTTRYTYGYGRAEDLAGIFIVAMIALSAVVAGYESFRRLLDPAEVTFPWVLIAAGLIGFAGNELVASYRIRVGRKIGSAALVADGLHARTDGFTSLAVVGGAAGVLLGFPLADPIVGLLITLAILLVLRGAARDIYRRLMDAVDPQLSQRATTVLLETPGVRAIEHVRLRWIGHRLALDAGIVVTHDLSLTAAHDIAHDAQHRLVHQITKLADATIHVSPERSGDADPHAQIAHHDELVPLEARR
jgi:cation diffusion facilitator family transporter